METILLVETSPSATMVESAPTPLHDAGIAERFRSTMEWFHVPVLPLPSWTRVARLFAVDLHYAAYWGKEDKLKVILKSKTADVNKKDRAGQTPLQDACRAGRVASVKRLLDHPKIDVNYADPKDWTALHFAVIWKRTDIVKILLSREEIELDKKNEDGNTALEIAKDPEDGNEEIAGLLKDAIRKKRRERKAKPYGGKQDGKTALEISKDPEDGNEEIAGLLKDAIRKKGRKRKAKPYGGKQTGKKRKAENYGGRHFDDPSKICKTETAY